jgi:hypothetical protein
MKAKLMSVNETMKAKLIPIECRGRFKVLLFQASGRSAVAGGMRRLVSHCVRFRHQLPPISPTHTPINFTLHDSISGTCHLRIVSRYVLPSYRQLALTNPGIKRIDQNKIQMELWGVAPGHRTLRARSAFRQPKFNCKCQ